MADNAQAKMTSDQAYQVLLTQTHHPVFFTKLAEDFGIVPQTEEHAYELLKIAANLRQKANVEVQKAANESADWIKKASSDLEAELGNKSAYNQLPNAQLAEVRQAALIGLQNPLFKQAAQVFGEALQK